MDRQEIEREIEDLKADYARLSADLEKLVYVGANTTGNEKELERIEKQVAALRKQLQTKR
ncbi:MULTISPECIES: SE1832 family protein [Gracilibacillus]|uniref:SE1832 family protein n=1 Tax=Gracilibacillus TaxID=74385 RepID=UPI000826AAE7|nr:MULTISPECIES: SE1832 family protein [Gracilibacillus]